MRVMLTPGFLLVLLLSAEPATAGVIGIYADTQGSSCQLTLNSMGTPVNTYVVQKYNWFGATGAVFKIDDASTLVQSGWSSSFTTTGDPYTGVSVDYGSCVDTQAIVIMTLTHTWLGQSVSCGMLQMAAAPGHTVPVVRDCSSTEDFSGGLYFLFNPGPACFCENPTAPATWGSVKALYR